MIRCDSLSRKNLICTRHPRTFAEYLLDIFREYHFAGYQSPSKLCMTFGILAKYLLGPRILLGNNTGNLFINQAGAVLAIWLGEAILLTRRVIVANIWELVAHAVIDHHGIRLLGDTLKVIGCTSRDMSDKQLLGSTSAKGGTHLVKYGLRRGNLTLLWQIPCRAKGFASRHYGHLYQRVSIFEMP